jgi:hypothetical protein
MANRSLAGSAIDGIPETQRRSGVQRVEHDLQLIAVGQLAVGSLVVATGRRAQAARQGALRFRCPAGSWKAVDRR